MPRLAPLDPAEFTPEQQRIAEAIMAGRGGLRGPFLPWMRSPELCDRAQRLGEFCRYHSSLEPFLSEFAILVTARYWKAQFEFFAHATVARQAGVADVIIEAVRTGAEPPLEDERHRAIYAFVTECFRDHRVSDATYDRAQAVLTERGVVDLVGIVGYYSLVSLTLNVFEVPLPDGEPDPLP
ncbi:MAG: carboxymuconolactone decarboxylase family protein [Dehalococcoidia bacterium]